MASGKPSRQRVRSLSIYEKTIRRLGTFRIVRTVTPPDLRRAGFTRPTKDGDSILPAVVGPVTDFNVNGKEIIRRDLPMVTKEFMLHTSWQDWHGNEHSGTQVRSMEVYQRDTIPPPSEYLTAATRGSERLLCSRVLSVKDDAEDDIIHALNIFLEMFGQLEIVSENLEGDKGVKVNRVNWNILPPGPYPFSRAKAVLADFLRHLEDTDRPVVEDRIQHVTRFTPDFIAVGVGGFSDYVVFGFSDRDIYVLESPRLGNATYIFNKDWAVLSTKTKADILTGRLHERRLIHNHRWHAAVREELEGERKGGLRRA